MDYEQDGVTARLDSKVQKLIILFVFDRMAIPLSEATVLDVCTSDNDWLSYMDCKQYLNELSKQICFTAFPRATAST